MGGEHSHRYWYGSCRSCHTAGYPTAAPDYVDFQSQTLASPLSKFSRVFRKVLVQADQLIYTKILQVSRQSSGAEVAEPIMAHWVAVNLVSGANMAKSLTGPPVEITSGFFVD